MKMNMDRIISSEWDELPTLMWKHETYHVEDEVVTAPKYGDSR